MKRVTTGGKKTLDRVLSRAGFCSRTQARAAIAAGRVQVNGRTTRDPERWIDSLRDRVTVDEQPLQVLRREVWMLHKPVGVVTTASDERGRPTVYSLLPVEAKWLAPIGRLDLHTSGLLLFTNDSDLAHAITEPSSELTKVYEVRCAGLVGTEAIRRLAGGVELDDGPTRPARCERIAGDDQATLLRLAITEGRNRQVRRMVAAIGSRVLALHRTHVGPLQLGDLPVGERRRLTADELAALRAAVGAGRR